MTKYVTKTEPITPRRIKRLFLAKFAQTGHTGGDTALVLKRVMTALYTSRVISQQETCHLICGSKFVLCSHTFKMINLRNDMSQLDENSVKPKRTMIDAYAKRFEPEKWEKGTIGLPPHELESMSVDTFVRRFTLGKMTSKLKPWPPARKNVFTFNPNYFATPESENYVEVLSTCFGSISTLA